MNELNLIAPISETGYGLAAFNIIKALSKKIKVNLYPAVAESDLVEDPIYKKCLENKNFKSKENPCLLIFGQGDLYRFIGKDKHIGMCFFELDRFTDQEKDSILHCDLIFVASKWAKDIVVKELKQLKPNIEETVHVVPLGVDRDIFYDDDSYKLNQKTTIFYNCGKWERRKGHDFLIECFNQAFDENDDVQLWMQCHNFFIGPENNKSWENLYSNTKLGKKIIFVPRQKTHKDVAKVMNTIDCGIFTVRAEGWNLELLEVLSCGKNVITSNYSGHMEYCNNENSMLFEIKELEQAFDGMWNQGQGFWGRLAEKQKDQIVKHMIETHNKKQNNLLCKNQSGIQTAMNFSWDATADKICKIIWGQI